MVGHVHAGTAEREHGQNVGFQRVADHQEAPRVDGVAAKNHAVGTFVFFGEDFDVLEMVREAGAGEFALLVAEIALGDDKQPMRAGQRGEGFDDAVEQIDGMGEHLLAERDDLIDFLRADLAGGELDGGLDRGEGEALHAVAVEFEVAHLGGEEGAIDGGRVVVAREEVAVAYVDLFKNIFVVPKGVVGVETEGERVSGSSGHARGKS